MKECENCPFFGAGNSLCEVCNYGSCIPSREQIEL